jgi:hypothetical protein
MKALFTFCIFTFAISVLNGQDLIRNGGFENFNHFEFWDSSVTVTGASVTPVITQAHSGFWSVEIKSGTTPVGGWTQLLQTLLTPSNNIDYKLAFFVKGFVTDTNFLGVYGLTGSGEVALGIDSLNNTTSIDPDSGRIILTQDVFQLWTRINYYFNSGQDYTGYLLKFEEASSGSSLDVYFDDFTIEPVPGQGTVQVTSPNGGEDWLVGSQQNVTWISSNISNVKISYSTNNGVNWLNVVSSVPAATGSYSWTIPNTPSEECLVRINDVGNVAVFDVSDNIFTISAAVTVTAPNGGEDWIAGEQHDITWVSQNLTNVKIEHSSDNGITWSNVVASVPAVNEIYTWTIPNTISSQCLVRISDVSNALVNDISDSNFTISAAVTVTAPNGGEDWVVGEEHNITWTNQTITNVAIEYSTDNGSNWVSVISSTPATSGSYNWTVPNTPSTQCLVRISDASDPLINDVSDATFTISPAPSITVTTPNGGETWFIGEVNQVKWTRQLVSHVKIEYSIDNGSTWNVIIASILAGFGSYNWTIPDTPSEQCLVRISDVNNAAVNDISDNTFTIEEPVSVEDLKSGIPDEYGLSQNYPNPFNPSTTIKFSLPEETIITLTIYNILGEKVTELFNGKLDAGFYSYKWNAYNVESGIYIYEFRTEKFVSLKKMILLK